MTTVSDAFPCCYSTGPAAQASAGLAMRDALMQEETNWPLPVELNRCLDEKRQDATFNENMYSNVFISLGF